MENSYLIETLAMVAGVLLSLLVEVPAIKQYYDRLGNMGKRLVMALLLVLAGAGLYGLACAQVLAVLFPGLLILCDQSGVTLLLRAVLFAMVTNQGTFGLFFRDRKPPAPSYEYYEPDAAPGDGMV